MPSWKLNENQFTLSDKIKIALFFLNPKNRWTQGDKVKEIEIQMARLCGSKYSVFVSSGSTANTLLAMYCKDKYYTKERNIVVLPAVTWQTSCAPWIREGFTPKFIDINLSDLSIDLTLLDEYLSKNEKNVCSVFITSLLGFSPDISKLLDLQSKYPQVKFFMDNCESNLSDYEDSEGRLKNISSAFTSTTSTYFGHQIQSIEGGFIFTNDESKYLYFLKARNHGMMRSITEYKDFITKDGFLNEMNNKNNFVDFRFDFNLFGNNFRNTDVNAFIGLLDLKRWNKYKTKRKNLFDMFSKSVNKKMFLTFNSEHLNASVPFCLPIIFKNNPDINIDKIKYLKCLCENYCAENDIEIRPIISGNLIRQTCYQQYGKPEDFPKAEFLHHSGFYIGLHSKVSEKQIKQLVEFLNHFDYNE